MTDDIARRMNFTDEQKRELDMIIAEMDARSAAGTDMRDLVALQAIFDARTIERLFFPT